MTQDLGGAMPSSALDLITQASGETKLVLAVLGLFSLVAWFLIGLKWWQLRRLRQQADRFFGELERTTRLEEAYHAVMKLPPSPYNRLFREAVHFFSELKPGALQGDAASSGHSLTQTQVGALRMVMAKEIAAERDLAAHYTTWLATIGSVSPLLGLLGTVLGIMRAFLGIAAQGSGNIAAVAPGVAEALITTVAGLMAAIPAVIAYNFFVNRIRLFAGELEGFANELVGSMAREGLL